MKRLPLWKRPWLARRVLDIGAGHNPFYGVTHVVEIDLTEGRQRGGKKLLIPKLSKLIVGNIEGLPFLNGTFDFVYASHVIEHVRSPCLACREIIRVGEAGYIETPSPFLEQGLALHATEATENSFHKWFVFTLNGNLLVFEPKNLKTVSEFCSCSDGQFMKEFYECVEFAEAQHCFRRKAKSTIFFWKSSFHVEVRDRTTDCRKEKRGCRFTGMKRALLANCNDLLRADRLRYFVRTFPKCKQVFRKYGHRTALIW